MRPAEFVEPGGQKYLKWARQRLSALADMREDLNLPVMTKDFSIGSSNIWIKSSDFGDLIRITGAPDLFFVLGQVDPRAQRIQRAGQPSLDIFLQASIFGVAAVVTSLQNYRVQLAIDSPGDLSSFDEFILTPVLGAQSVLSAIPGQMPVDTVTEGTSLSTQLLDLRTAIGNAVSNLEFFTVSPELQLLENLMTQPLTYMNADMQAAATSATAAGQALNPAFTGTPEGLAALLAALQAALQVFLSNPTPENLATLQAANAAFTAYQATTPPLAPLSFVVSPALFSYTDLNYAMVPPRLLPELPAAFEESMILAPYFAVQQPGEVIANYYNYGLFNLFLFPRRSVRYFQDANGGTAVTMNVVAGTSSNPVYVSWISNVEAAKDYQITTKKLEFPGHFDGPSNVNQIISFVVGDDQVVGTTQTVWQQIPIGSHLYTSNSAFEAVSIDKVNGPQVRLSIPFTHASYVHPIVRTTLVSNGVLRRDGPEYCIAVGYTEATTIVNEAGSAVSSLPPVHHLMLNRDGVTVFDEIGSSSFVQVFPIGLATRGPSQYMIPYIQFDQAFSGDMKLRVKWPGGDVPVTEWPYFRGYFPVEEWQGGINVNNEPAFTLLVGNNQTAGEPFGWYEVTWVGGVTHRFLVSTDFSSAAFNNLWRQSNGTWTSDGRYFITRSAATTRVYKADGTLLTISPILISGSSDTIHRECELLEVNSATGSRTYRMITVVSQSGSATAREEVFTLTETGPASATVTIVSSVARGATHAVDDIRLIGWGGPTPMT